MVLIQCLKVTRCLISDLQTKNGKKTSLWSTKRSKISNSFNSGNFSVNKLTMATVTNSSRCHHIRLQVSNKSSAKQALGDKLMVMISSKTTTRIITITVDVTIIVSTIICPITAQRNSSHSNRTSMVAAPLLKLIWLCTITSNWLQQMAMLPWLSRLPSRTIVLPVVVVWHRLFLQLPWPSKLVL